MPGLVSAEGILSFLDEEETELKVFALKTLNEDIDTVWTEVAGALSQLCVLAPVSCLSLVLAPLSSNSPIASRSTKMNLSRTAS